MNVPPAPEPAFTLLQPWPKTAIQWKDAGISYADLLAHSAALASLYFSSPGERIVLFSENRPEWISALYSIWRNRGVAVPVDAMSPAAEVAYILAQTQPVAIFCSDKTQPVVREALASLPDASARIIDLNPRAIDFFLLSPENACGACSTAGSMPSSAPRAAAAMAGSSV